MSSASPTPNVEDATPKDYREKFQGRGVVSKFVDPCENAAKASMDCLNRNDYDRDKCTDFFRAYRECKSSWSLQLEQRREDRRAGRPVN